jgi:nucleoside-diphosphate-sugar epimerase
MLILIAGITGNIGQRCALYALSHGHQVRGLGRSPSKLPGSISTKLESFVQSKNCYDIEALDKAVTGVDAIITAYGWTMTLLLDGQLLLLRAAERAGVRRFHAASWNMDWSEQPLGLHETYDVLIAFMQVARVSSPIRPLYVFVGAFAQTFFSVPGAGALETDDNDANGYWVRKGKERMINAYGTGEEVTEWTTEDDAAAFSVELVTSDLAEKGGYYDFCSDKINLKQLKETYEKVTGKTVEWKPQIGADVAEQIASGMRKDALEKGEVYKKYLDYIGLYYMIYHVRETMRLNREQVEFPNVKRTSLEEYITQHPDI